MSLSAFSSGSPVGYTYHYDQLNRIKDLRQHSSLTSWSAGNINPGYREDFTFDGNGNILSAIRTAATAAVKDSLFYQYNKTAGRLSNNRLNYLNGTGAASSFGPPQIPGNYQYDANGELTTDKQAGLSNIKWSVYGKILSITKGKGTITYTYNPAGERVSKTVGGLTTFYIRDAQGNTLAVYDNKNDSVFWREQHLYGSSRIGMWTPNVNLADSNALAVWDSVGYKEYEGDNHLGNVNVTLSDIRTPHYDGSGNLLYYTANVKTSQDYYAYGALQPGRQFVDTSGVYRYGFNGKENDNEVKGVGDQQDYGERIYDPRVGKFLSVDPIAKSYPMLTPYQFASNRPIDGVDRDGKEYESFKSRWIVSHKGVAALPIIKSDNGFGPLVLATYDLKVKGTANDFNRLKVAYTTNPGIVHNPGNWLGEYTPIKGADNKSSTLKVGDHMYIDISGPFNDYVRFTDIKVTNNSFYIKAATLYGHTDAGFITFSGSFDPASGKITFDIHNETTDNLGISAPFGLGRIAQTAQWKIVLNNVAKFLGGSVESKTVDKTIVRQDAKKGDAEKVTHEDLLKNTSSETYQAKPQ